MSYPGNDRQSGGNRCQGADYRVQWNGKRAGSQEFASEEPAQCNAIYRSELRRHPVIESELFGHEKGAFTSAIKQHKGKFEQADGGTLFLDEIGDMSLAAQAKVLRVLQEKKLSRVGSDKDINVDVRVLAATNKNLKEEIAKGNFREDLYHRLSVIVINVPSLDERKDDIPLLVNYFIEQICAETGMQKLEIDKDALKLLVDRSWTGNIRELRNVVERLLILSSGRITAADVKAYVY